MALKRHASTYLERNPLKVSSSLRTNNTLSSERASLVEKHLCDCDNPSAQEPDFDFVIHKFGRHTPLKVKSDISNAFMRLKIPGLGLYVKEHGIELASSRTKDWLKSLPDHSVHKLQQKEEEKAKSLLQSITVPAKETQDAIVAGQRVYQGFLTPTPVITTTTATDTMTKSNTSRTTLHKALSQALKEAEIASVKAITASTPLYNAQGRYAAATKALADAEEVVTRLCKTTALCQMSSDRASLHTKLAEALGKAEGARKTIEDANREASVAMRKKEIAMKEVADANDKVDEICEEVAGIRRGYQ